WTILSLGGAALPAQAGWPRLSQQDLLQRVPCPCLSWFWRDRAGQFIPTDYLQGQAKPFPFSSCPLGLDFHHTLDAGNVTTKAGCSTPTVPDFRPALSSPDCDGCSL